MMKFRTTFNDGLVMFFTLVELLMVISIIVILMSILLPALGKAKAASKSIACTNNLKQTGVCVGGYLPDYNEWIPAAYSATTTPVSDWEYRLLPYSGYKAKIFCCPSSYSEIASAYSLSREMPDTVTETTYKDNMFNYCGLGINSNAPPASPYWSQAWGWQKITKISRPGRTLLVCDSYGDSNGHHAFCVRAQSSVRQISNRHNNGANVLFFDGHCEWKKWEFLNNDVNSTGIWIRD